MLKEKDILCEAGHFFALHAKGLPGQFTIFVNTATHAQSLYRVSGEQKAKDEVNSLFEVQAKEPERINRFLRRFGIESVGLIPL